MFIILYYSITLITEQIHILNQTTMRKTTRSVGPDTYHIIGLNNSRYGSPLVAECMSTEVTNPHVSQHHPYALTKTTIIITWPYSPIPYINPAPPTTQNQITLILTEPEGVAWGSLLQIETPILNKTTLSINTEEEGNKGDMEIDSTRIDAHKFNPLEAIDAVKSAFKNLPYQDNIATVKILIGLLNTHLGIFCKDINTKQTKPTNHISCCDRDV